MFIYFIHSCGLGGLYKKFNPMQQMQLFVETTNSKSANKTERKAHKKPLS
ncbi:hypothetical protein IFVP203_C1140061 [Vibrio parahaemolyticus]